MSLNLQPNECVKIHADLLRKITRLLTDHPLCQQFQPDGHSALLGTGRQLLAAVYRRVLGRCPNPLHQAPEHKEQEPRQHKESAGRGGFLDKDSGSQEISVCPAPGTRIFVRQVTIEF
jgi:hypothetical protein